LEQRQAVRDEPVIVGRYAIYDRIAAGGMATVHLGRLVGERGFSRTVAIKRLHPHLAMDPDFVGMFLDEARLAARVRHPNVVPTIDVVAKGDEVFLVMEYVDGEPLSALLRAANERGERVPIDYVSTLVTGILEGLHAAHQAIDDQGQPLNIVHRDISPHNVLVGVDGIARVIDFGVAKAMGQVHSTREGQIRGKLAYMSPEQVRGASLDGRTDVFAASVVLWECLTGQKLFKAENDMALMRLLLSAPIEPPSQYAPEVPPALDAVVLRGLERDVERRYASADAMAAALTEALPGAPARKVGAWVRELGGKKLLARAAIVLHIERSAGGITPASIERPSPVADSGRGDTAPRSQPTQASGVSVASPSVFPAQATTGRALPVIIGGSIGLAFVVGVVGLFQLHVPSSPVSAPSAPDSTSAAVSPPLGPSPPAPAAPPPPPAPSASAATSSAPSAPAVPAATAEAPGTSHPVPPGPTPGHTHHVPPPAASSKIFSRY
jgi:serine/threonine-protein kinase